METNCCNSNCCNYKLSRYEHKNKTYKIKKLKGGIFIYDPESYKILLVQSRGNLWGPPKGSIEDGESIKQCASRETVEETGIFIDVSELNRYTKINSNSVYFYYEMKEREVHIQRSNIVYKNDATGIGWFKPSCLQELMNDEKIKITQYCKIVIKKFLGIKLETNS